MQHYKNTQLVPKKGRKEFTKEEKKKQMKQTENK